MNTLGAFYYKGKAVKHDSMNALGDCYYDGKGVKQDYKKKLLTIFKKHLNLERHMQWSI